MNHIFQSSPDTQIVDIPSSISSPPGCILRSSNPPKSPYVLPEPKDPNFVFNQDLLDLHLQLRQSLATALENARSSFSGPYCAPRVTEPPENGSDEVDFHANTSHLAYTVSSPQILSPTETLLDDVSDLYAGPVFSPSNHWTTLTLQYPSPPKSFHIPPRSSFLLAPVQSSVDTFTSLAAESPFDFVLLDPPWPNRSAARATKYKTSNRFDVVPLLQKIPLRSALTANGLVGIWVTNKPKLRKAVLEDVFRTWGLEFAGQWAWLKVTEQGEPVYDMESRMRKPYELLIFGRKKSDGKKKSRRKRARTEDLEEHTEGQTPEKPQTGMPEKTILAVPDLHSRKPCIKQLIEPFLPPTHRACEIFGRCLTEGWFTWGDEAIKWNWEGHWARIDNDETMES